MKRFQWMIAILLVTFAQLAHADSFSSFNLTTITVDVLPDQGGDNVIFSLTGPGTNITGMGGINCLKYWCAPFTTIPLGSGVFANIGQIFLSNFNSAVVGGKSYSREEFGFNPPFFITVLGQITFPGHPQNSFSTCVPATVKGPITGHAGSGETYTQFSLNTPTGGSFCTTWNFVDSLNGYQFVRGKFSVSTVPEPGTLGMMGSGLVAIFGSALRKGLRQAVAVSGLLRLGRRT